MTPSTHTTFRAVEDDIREFYAGQMGAHLTALKIAARVLSLVAAEDGEDWAKPCRQACFDRILSLVR